jgi:hypothetical protein
MAAALLACTAALLDTDAGDMPALAAVLLAGCGEQTSSSGAGSDATSSTTTSSGASATDTPSPAWTGAVIPDGTYTKTRTTADAKRLGIPMDRATKILGDDGEFHTELKIAGDAWAEFGDDDGPMTLGDEGTATYDAQGHWVNTSNSIGCPGCVQTFKWSLNGERLTLTMIDTTEAGDPVGVLVSRLVMEGTWTRR